MNVPVITSMQVIPVAGYDSMLMTLSGCHAPCFTRNIVILKDSAGHTGIGEIHGQLIRRGTCGNAERCDYCIVGSGSALAAEYETVTDEGGFLVSRKKKPGQERGGAE